MSPSQQDQQFVERAIDRAVEAVKELMGAELRAIRVELRALNDRQSRVDHVEEQIAAVSDRLTAVEAFKNQHEHRLGKLEEGRRDLRRWLWDHAPSLTLAGIALAYSLLH